jgi:DNA-binding NarL/FixJ family response regulator
MRNVLLVEDHAIVRMGVKMLIEDCLPPVNVVEAVSFTETLRQLQSRFFDLVILDIKIPGGEGFNMITKIKAIQSKVKILIFSSQDEELYALHYYKAGASGYLPKESSNEVLEKAISSVLNGGTYISNVVQRQLVSSTMLERESKDSPLEILLIGKWTKDIASDLNIKESTVSTYKARIFEKLNVTNILELFKKVEIYKNQKMKYQ